VIAVTLESGAKAAAAFDWLSLVAPGFVFAGVLVTVFFGLRTTRRTLRANILSTSRLKWLEGLRSDLASALTDGERLYKPIPGENPAAHYKAVSDLRTSSLRLVVLLGREDQVRMELAEAVRAFAHAPTAIKAEAIEVLAQGVFREQWNKVRTETGAPAREKGLLQRGRQKNGPYPNAALALKGTSTVVARRSWLRRISSFTMRAR
jgi:hypothetical protein